VDPKTELEDKIAAKRDKEMAARVKAHKRDSKSLLDRHQEKSKKSKVRNCGCTCQCAGIFTSETFRRTEAMNG
jgi:hypothetical protein